MQLHFYDAITAGKSSVEGQVVRFDSALFSDGQEPVIRSTAIRLRDDLFISPAGFENSDLFDTPLSEGIDEYQWTRQIAGLFTMRDCIHIGLGSSAGYDGFIQNALYRNLADHPNTCMPPQSHKLDLATVIRAIHLLRPETLPWDFDRGVGSDAQVRRRLIWDAMSGEENRALRVQMILAELMGKSEKLVQFAMRNTSPERIKRSLGFEHGAVSDLQSIKPCFLCHQTVTNERRAGVFMPVAVDISYPDIIYLADLECDLTELCDPDCPSLEALVRHSPTQAHLPLIRVNLSRVPFIAPLGTIRPEDAKRLGVDATRVKSNVTLLRTATAVAMRLLDEPIIGNTRIPADVDYRMLAGEYPEPDLQIIRKLHDLDFGEWMNTLALANDNRILELGRRLILRHRPHHLSENEQSAWVSRVRARVAGGSFTPDRVAALLKQAEDNARAYPTARGLTGLAERIRRILGDT